MYRRRRLTALAVLILVVAAVALIVSGGGGGGNTRPLAYSSDREAELALRASEGFSDVVYEKSPGGVVATAKRVAHWRPLVERAAQANGVDPDTLEAIVFLESAGRPDVIAGGNIEGAVGLTQILASTATALLHMHVDTARSKSLTARIADATTDAQARKLERARRKADQRFDPAQSVGAAAIYLAQAKKTLGRDDLAVASYHMGMGNLQTALKRYGDAKPSYTKLYFDSTPLHKPRAYSFLSALGDDSSTYLWRVQAAEAIMRLYRDDPAKLRHLAALDQEAGGGARRLFPNGAPKSEPKRRQAPSMPGLRFTGDAKSDFAPNPGTAAALAYIGAGIRAISGPQPLNITSAHGVRIDVSRRYASRKQALAFQYLLDRLQAWNLIAWGRGANTLAIVVGPEAAKVLPSSD